MTALYNEIDEYAAQWLRNLIAAGHIAPGVVDTRSVEDLPPDYVSRFTQVHLFAGIGVWSYAARLAGISDDRPLWTLSCPCQPFSAAGKGGGFTDERHLWPAAFHLIEQCRPRRLYGEQVADRGGLAWLDLVQADLEGTGYAFGAVDTCSAGFGAPHRRQRLRFVARDMADTASNRRSTGLSASSRGYQGDAEEFGNRGGGFARPGEGRSANDVVDRLADDNGVRLEQIAAPGLCTDAERDAQSCGGAGDMVDASGAALERPRPTNGFWRLADWLLCRDPSGPKWRPVEPGTFPLAHGAPSRVGRLRAYGNAVDAQATKAFIEATL